ncbi:hypothetical protein [Microcoleus sp. herbarium14]|uniref:hypothetical protein n=1 Tax=Microcoleus sp. herbarium14 TaxID=3055439 RepID=UPI002FD2A22D
MFSLAKTSPSSPVDWKVDAVTVTSGDGCIPTFKSLPDKQLRSSGDDGDVFTPCLETSQPSNAQHTTAPSTSNSAVKPRTFEIGSRVVAKDVGGIYQGARGEVVDILYGSASDTYLVRFDKLVRGTQQSEFEAFDLMKL